jgi:glyoxylase-like metal-dependent hydrolase (beta-lactamase superfamily II)
MLALFLAALGGCASHETSDQTAQTDANNVGAGAHLIRGSFSADRQPDGNTVVLDGKTGLIVFDTGRHPEHADKIIAFAKARGEPIVAIINSHWHLDHISGNIPLRAAYPKTMVYSNDPALTEALGSFLARGAEFNRKRLADPKTEPGDREDARVDLATVEQGEKLRPNVSLEKTQTLKLDGRELDIHVAAGASAGDVWFYDRKARLVATGDLITLPAPFLDTACPAKWSTAFANILAQPFVRVVPGHGHVMVRSDVVRYRDAFNALLACARGDATAEACAGAWADAAAPLQDDPAKDRSAAIEYASYYVTEILRKPSKRAGCGG